MRFLKIILPFLFVRNWYTGEWELSRVRAWLFTLFLVLFLAVITVTILLLAPTIYNASAPTA